MSFSKRTNLKSILTINKEKEKGGTQRTEVQTGREGEGEGNKALKGREERRRKGRKEIEKREEGRSGKEGRK